MNQPQPVPVSGISPAGHVQPPYTAPVLHQDRTFAAPPNAHPPSSKPFLCPVCGVGSRRPQERKRHLLSHLPCWIACSFRACPWRGDRSDTFAKHLYDEHQTIRLDDSEHGYQLYNPWPLVEGVVEGSISIEDAKQRAIAEVEGMASVIGKQELLEDPWGRKGKKRSRR